MTLPIRTAINETRAEERSHSTPCRDRDRRGSWARPGDGPGTRASRYSCRSTAARERGEIETIAEEIRQRCGECRVVPVVADVTQEEDCARVVEAAVKQFGRLDILVSNAG